MTNLANAQRKSIYLKVARPAVFLAAVMIVLLALPAAALAEGETETRCHPIAGWLAWQMGDEGDWEALMTLHAGGVGYGQMAKAWYLSRYLLADDGDWTTLLDLRREENGWGELAHAVRLADALSGLEVAVTPEELLALREEPELGWGQIRQAAALAAADLGLSFGEAVDDLAGGAGWGEIREALDLDPGPPPWAGTGGNKGGQARPAGMGGRWRVNH